MSFNVPPASAARLKDEYAKHPSVKQLAQEMGLSVTSVRMYAWALGLKRHKSVCDLRGERGTLTGARTKSHGYWFLGVHGERPIAEHRYVMEQHLGRKLTEEEVVHHMNGKKHDNRLENLKLFANEEEHQEWHRQHPEIGKFNPHRILRKIVDGKLYCPSCDEDKPLSEFSPNKSARIGYHGHCKACNAARVKAYLHSKKRLAGSPKSD